MNKKERMEQFKEQIAQLSKELAEFEAKQGEFKVGDWLYFRDAIDGFILLTESSINKYGGYTGHILSAGMDIQKLSDVFTYRKATPSKIESALRKEWNRRCTEAGWDNGDEVEVEKCLFHESYGTNSGGLNPEYNKTDDRLWTVNGCVYQQGEWATPRKKAVKFFEWDVTKAEDTIQIGCQKLSKYFLMGLQSELRNVSDKTVQEVLDELKKLDL